MRRYVLIVNWNGWADTIECLESLFRIDDPLLRVIVCDNGSNDNSIAHIRQWAEGLLDALPVASPLDGHAEPAAIRKPISVREYHRPEAEKGGDLSQDPALVLIHIGENLGFAGGNNVGLRYALARADFDYVWLLNNDTVVAGDALQALVERMAERPDAGMCGSTLLRYDAPEKVQARCGGWYCKWIGLPWHFGQLGRADDPPAPERIERWMSFVVGASLMVRREFLETVGLMSEDYFLFFEELDWAMRSRGRYGLAYAPRSVVYHKVGRSIGTSSNPRRKSLVCDFYAVRNRLLFTRKFLPEALPTIYLSILTAALVRLLVGKPGHARMILAILAGRASLPGAGYGQ
jgi:GT2 family glycosyltransferase